MTMYQIMQKHTYIRDAVRERDDMDPVESESNKYWIVIFTEILVLGFIWCHKIVILARWFYYIFIYFYVYS